MTDKKIGYLSQVRYEICDELDMRVPAYVMELDLRVLSQWYGKDRAFTQSQNLMMRREILLLLWTRISHVSRLKTVSGKPVIMSLRCYIV